MDKIKISEKMFIDLRCKFCKHKSEEKVSCKNKRPCYEDIENEYEIIPEKTALEKAREYILTIRTLGTHDTEFVYIWSVEEKIKLYEQAIKELQEQLNEK